MKKNLKSAMMILAVLLVCLFCAGFDFWSDLFGKPQQNDPFVDMGNQFLKEIYGENAPQMSGTLTDNLNGFMTEMFGENAPQLEGTFKENMNKFFSDIFEPAAPQPDKSKSDIVKELISQMPDIVYLSSPSEVTKELPIMNGKKEYRAAALPEYMTDVWVPYNETRVVVFTDNRTGLQGIADADGRVLMKPTCKHIVDNRNRGMIQNTIGHYYDIVCAQVDDLDNYDSMNSFGWINLKDFSIEWGWYFGGRGFNDIIEYHDGLSIIQESYEKTPNPKYGYLDKDENIAINFQFDMAGNFDDGYAVVTKDGKWSIIEKNGKAVFNYGAWKSISHVQGRVFVAQTKSGRCYRIELPKSTKSSVIVVPKSRVSIEYNDHGDPEIIIDGNRQAALKICTNMVGSCPMSTRLKVGDMVHVKDDLDYGLRMRDTAGGNPTGIQAFPSDINGPIYFQVTDGPKCENGIVWYKVNFLGYHGWIAEGTEGQYYLEKK